AGGDRAPRLDALRWPGAAPPGTALHRAHRSARSLITRAERYHPRLAACALPDIAGEYPLWRHAAWACQIDQQTAPVLLRLRRALGNGGTGGAGRRSYHGMPHWGRTRRLEESQRAAGALTETHALPWISLEPGVVVRDVPMPESKSGWGWSSKSIMCVCTEKQRFRCQVISQTRCGDL